MALSSLFITLPIPNVPSPKPRRMLTSRASSDAPAASASFDLRRYWTSLIADVESELDAAMPMQPPESIHYAMRYAVLPGAGKEGAAKRAPPVLCVAACELLGAPRAAALPAAAALEMLHAASLVLVHDDLPCFDAAPTRRGRPSTHAAYGTDMAVLAGDALFPLAYTHVISHTPSPDPVPHAVLLRVLAELARAVGSTGMAAGQFLDLAGATALGEAEVMQVLTKKFGEMAECSAACGAMLGGAGPDEEAELRRYGRTIGVLYELVDDIRSASGNGKMRSNASVLRSLGMDRALGIVEELKAQAKTTADRFAEKYGDRVLPLYSFVDYAVERGFELQDAAATP
ncbi:putative geranylgeranyl pyrophosphate synthase 4 [Zea mays]|jgi:geranylgeranyl diphosphate synthase, type II|uniref:Geranylgeranyl pyrophosphate synthase4 n=1 Tax=Zea mays TaxID=4577 RepID=D3G6F2_MAIZE|nr:putative geranylgeranyl pyrophosphate synthase 4 [Zea mays]ABQ85649.1 putative geranylgeranyl pyrophosphate synthase 4 [Zea mays]AQK73403.1 geranylgeranyl pyrophosphate synthase4 [Zea mays]|eukprot:NP_001183942.1 putative geranylgeranyl pyrophosphate synthase 4 [Zea mays]